MTIYFSIVAIGGISATVLIAAGLTEVRQMRERAKISGNHSHKKVDDSAMYIAVISVACYIGFIPFISSVLVYMMGVTTRCTCAVCIVLQSLYCMGNILMYGPRHASYHQQVKEELLLLGENANKSRVGN